MSKIDAQLLETPGLAEQVIELLSRKQSLPDVGIVAGQSVASAIDEILGTGTAVYNDIDIFLEDPHWASVTGELFPGVALPPRARIVGPVDFRGNPVLVADEYLQAFHIASRTSYCVIKTERDRLLNLVLVKFENTAANAQDKVTPLIAGFDLNNIQVAIDLKTRTLRYTKHFTEYFEGRELRLVTVFTPFQSLLRYFKKRDELHAYGNDDYQIEMVRHLVYANEGDVLYREDRVQAFKAGVRWMPTEKTAAFNSRNRRSGTVESCFGGGTGARGHPLAIGQKNGILLERWMPKLAPFFEVTKHPRSNVWLLTSRPDAPQLPYVGQLTVTPTLISARFRELKLPPGPLVATRRAEFQKFCAWLSPDLRGMYRTAYAYHGDSFLVGVESQQGWRELQAVLNAHEEVVHAIASIPVGDQIRVVRNVRAVLKKLRVPEAWGIFQGKPLDWVQKALTDKDWLYLDIDHQIGSPEPLLPPERRLPLPDHLEGVSIRELCTPRELVIEGARMRHCVGGYGDAVARGRSRIVALQAGPRSTDCSTLELRPCESGGQHPVAQVQIWQNYTFSNRIPTEQLERAAGAVARYLNLWLRENREDGWYRLFGKHLEPQQADEQLPDEVELTPDELQFLMERPRRGLLEEGVF
jgi:hypothetical protein